MSTYLFITKLEFDPARVEVEEDVRWSCSSTTKYGDGALVYVVGVGIQFEWLVISDAERDERWKFLCEVEHSRTFVPPITIREIRDTVSQNEWAPPYQNFRGLKSIIIPPGVADQLRSLRPNAVAVNEALFPEEVVDTSGLVEGAVRRISINAYERNPEARRRCINAHGSSCSICQLNFGEVYGKVAEGYIHVHHLRSLSEVGGEYEVDPIHDLCPVCPNCHAVLHLRTPPYSVEEVRGFLEG